jgi:hypothetical protein
MPFLCDREIGSLMEAYAGRNVLCTETILDEKCENLSGICVLVACHGEQAPIVNLAHKKSRAWSGFFQTFFFGSNPAIKAKQTSWHGHCPRNHT